MLCRAVGPRICCRGSISGNGLSRSQEEMHPTTGYTGKPCETLFGQVKLDRVLRGQCLSSSDLLAPCREPCLEPQTGNSTSRFSKAYAVRRPGQAYARASQTATAFMALESTIQLTRASSSRTTQHASVSPTFAPWCRNARFSRVAHIGPTTTPPCASLTTIKYIDRHRFNVIRSSSSESADRKSGITRNKPFSERAAGAL